MTPVSIGPEEVETLRNEGICVVPNYRSESWCDDVRATIERCLESGQLDEASQELTHREKASAERPLVDRRGRGGHDQGMLDIFNIDLLVSTVQQVRDDPDILEAISACLGHTVRPTNTNTYLNRSITHTRGFHADSYRPQFKSFVYLTDVTSLEDGPFTYVPGSHRPSIFLKASRYLINRARGRPKTDALRRDPSRAMPCLARRGTLIISDQAGLHRGWPQASGAYRALVTVSYQAG